MKITIKKIIKAFMPYGILWMHNRINHELKIKNSKFKPRKALRFQIHITDHCNLNCKYCGHYSPVANKKFLDPAVFEKYLQRIQELTGGGEYRMHINTNAVIFKTEFAEGLFSNRIQLLISADAGSPDVYKAIKGVDYFTSVWENIKKYNNACLNNNGLDYGQVYVKFILQTENKNDIQNIINMCKKNNVRNVVLDWNMYSVENPVDYSNEVLIFIQLCRANNLNFTYGRFMPPVLNQTSINQELSK